MNFRKYFKAATIPYFWPALLRGVMPTLEHAPALAAVKPRSLIDVGANKGQFSIFSRYLYPDLVIHAFEPLAEEREICNAVVSRPFVVHPFALSDAAGDLRFFVTSRRDSSSLFAAGTNQYSAYGVRPVSETIVTTKRLDDVFEDWNLERPILLKIDVQGAELKVLVGATRALRCIDAVYCEVSFVDLYTGQPRAEEIIVFLSEHGFSLRGVYNLSSTKEFGPTQADLLFVRQ